MKLYGLDISKHNGTLDFKAIQASGNDFIILRAGYGTSTKDEMFETYYQQARAVGMKIGVYWYSYALNKNEAMQEAKKCLDIIKGKQFEYPVFIDMEDADQYKKKNGMPNNTTLVDICHTFCSLIESSGYYVGIYASESWFQNQLKSLSTCYDKWVANWGTNDGNLQSDKSSVYRLHQYTSSYQLNKKRFDRNICYYDYPSIMKSKGLNGYKQGTEETTQSKKTIAVMIDEVIAGKWGNGEERREGLMGAGYDYQMIQSGVNEKLSSYSFEIGKQVKIKASATQYVTGETIPGWVKETKYTIQQIKQDKILLKEISSWVYQSDIY